MSTRAASRSGFTLTEILIVISIIAVLLGLLLPALGGAWSQGEMAKSMNNMKQIASWMTEYSTGHRDVVLPSQFNYAYGVSSVYRGKVRSVPPPIGDQHKGTWADILWTEMNLGEAVGGLPGQDYRFDSPDEGFYVLFPSFNQNPLRAAARNTKSSPPTTAVGGMPTPFGAGAEELGEPGYFAANNFFNSDTDLDRNNRLYTDAEIRFPNQSMYLVDSFAGETIEDDCAAFDSSRGTNQVDFRYTYHCLMLFLDGHIAPQSRWATLDDLEQPGTGRAIRVRELDVRSAPQPCT